MLTFPKNLVFNRCRPARRRRRRRRSVGSLHSETRAANSQLSRQRILVAAQLQTHIHNFQVGKSILAIICLPNPTLPTVIV